MIQQLWFAVPVVMLAQLIATAGYCCGAEQRYPVGDERFKMIIKMMDAIAVYV